MIIKSIETERFQDYKVPAMFLAFPKCTFKCEKECKKRVCQNSTLAKLPEITIATETVIEKYLSNPITKAIICGGLEPMDSFDDLWTLINKLRNIYHCNDSVVIYTGYTKQECLIMGWLTELKKFKNIIIKFGRYVPNQQPHYDSVLGVNLASDNQYAEVIS